MSDVQRETGWTKAGEGYYPPARVGAHRHDETDSRLVSDGARLAALEAGQIGDDTRLDSLEAGQVSDDTRLDSLEASSLTAVRVHGASAELAGSAPNFVSSDFRIQTGSMVAGTDGAGDLTLTFPGAFPNGLLTVIVQQGDNTHPGATFIPYLSSMAKTGCKIRVYTNAAVAWVTSGNMRLTWIAIGY